jgi:fatty acid CoA ligase FadD9
VFESYGATEVGGITADGMIVAGTEVRLRDCPELGYFSIDQPNPRGEILVKTSSMSSGYYRDDERTKEAFVDGWYCTGDIGERLSGTKYRIIDRKKNIFKLANSEFVAPEPLENIYQTSLYIDQIFIPAETSKDYIVAVVLPNVQVVSLWAKENGIAFEDVRELKKNAQLKKVILDDMTNIAKHANRQHFEIVRSILIDFTEWTSDNRLLTGVMKRCRPELGKYYAAELWQLFTEIERAMGEVSTRAEDTLLGQLLAIATALLSRPISTDDSFLTVGGDSMSAVQLCHAFQTQTGVEMPVQLLLEGISFGNIAERLSSARRPTGLAARLKRRETKAEIDWLQEATLDEDIAPSISPKHVLLTGATGFLGKYLLRDLLANTEAKIYCHVRASDENAARQRLIEVAPEADSPRVVVVLGDLAEPRCGIAQAQYDALSHVVDTVIHNVG